MPYAKKRVSVFGSVLTPINTNISNKTSENRKKNLFTNNIHDSITTQKLIKSVNENSGEVSFSSDYICCSKKCFLNINNSVKTEILNYFNSMKSNDQKNEYLKSIVIPQSFIVRIGTIQPRISNFEYYAQFSDMNNPNLTVRKKVCVSAFLKLHNIKYSRLRTKILKNRGETEDKRGKHDSQYNKIPLEVEIDIREFIENYPSQESHYSPTVKTGRKYIESNKNISILYREFIEMYTEYDDYVHYQFFYHIFKDCNVGFGVPRSDICGTCEEFNVKIKSAIVEKSDLLENELKTSLNKHQIEADFFYKLQNELKSLAKSDPRVAVISMDYEKNFFVPVTKVSTEYYSRQLSIHNFGIHNMGEEKAVMFMYSENFALKGPNETISILNYYLQTKIGSNVKKIYIFSDNCFAQMKSRYLWLFYDILVKCKVYDEINLIYPIPGHSYLDCDRDFGLIEKLRKNVNKIALPSERVNIVKNANKKNPFEVVYVNHPLTDNLVRDSSDICTIYDYKEFFEPFLKSKLTYLTEVRRLKFTEHDIKISLD
jgi:hypothetical protein